MEDHFRNKFSEYEIIPSDGAWNKLEKKLFIREFFKFNATSFNVFYLAVILSLVTTGFVFMNSYSDNGIANSKGLKRSTLSEDVGQNNNSRNSNETKNSIEKAGSLHSTGNNKINEPNNGVVLDNGDSRKLYEPNNEDDRIKLIQSRTEDEVIENPNDKLFSEINEPIIRPRARYLVNVKSGCAPLNVRFINTSENATNYDWQFGDGGVSKDINPTYIFDKPGEYQVRLTASSATGEDVFEYDLIHVHEKPEANFEIHPTDVIVPKDAVHFHNFSRNAVQYEWSFGDGTISTLFEPTHYYSKTGSYNISLKAWSDHGCIDTITITNAFEKSVYEIRFPSAFTANPNGPSNGYYTRGLTTNEVFHPIYKGVAEYNLKIYDRFGTLVFESNEIDIGWDGYINDHLANLGVYIWKARGSYINGQTFVKFGNVTLIKK